VVHVAPATTVPAAVPAPAPPGPAKEPEDDSLHVITSPMVGTFYGAPSSDSEPYVRNGSSISADSTVCIVEAMKIMNEIKAEVSGTIEQVCVKNGQPIEFGQALFKVRLA
jgi:acetyl-CoA carboxylase biotin carboxyl carrier protein